MRIHISHATRGLLVTLLFAGAAEADESLRPVGVARVDITPDYPIRLNGFAGRHTESEGVRQPIWAKALAIGSDADGPAVLITVDALGVSDGQVERLAARLRERTGLDPARLAVTATHTHSAPKLVGVADTIYGADIPPEHQAHIDRYTREFEERLEQVALAALADRRPARLDWGIGRAGFAMNRRTKGGPVDHDLPTLIVREPEGGVRAVYVSYACHAVTLSDNFINGDWPGYAQEHIERRHPGAMALISVGCGADSNPTSGVTGGKFDIASQQGAEIAAEVERLLQGELRPVAGRFEARRERIELPFARHPTREEFARRAEKNDYVGYHARVQLARLDRGEKLAARISCPIQTWTFGESLALVFLPGEVVVDYALRLKRELDGRRLWINAYANAAPCYIPSERILAEGGYEGGDAMTFYDQPAPLAAGLEQPIIDVVLRQAGAAFRAPVDAARTGGSRPLSPEQSLATFRTRPGLAVELVAAEPLVASPVAIDFGPDGKLWVAEMYDYPQGLDGKFQPGGRVRLLESTGADGQFDKSTVFLEGIPFPTGVTVWRGGVLVCAAPDILFAEDTDGDGRADVVKKLYSGFGVDNYQARVNSLEYGLDGWVYGSCGLFGGQITSFAGGAPMNLGDRDFRIRPDTGEIEAATGRTQQGRVRDDWDNWFGCDSGTLARHYPLADHYLSRNPFLVPAETSAYLPSGPDADRLFPLNPEVQLFKLSGPSGRPTAACGLGIYRDTLLGEGFLGNAFTCEPVNLLVHRMQLAPRGSTFAGTRAAGEENSEFMAAGDNWFRPVQVRTGPDGALWIVDMYRYIIEHPRWIPPEMVGQLDVRAGHDLGRLYRVRPADGRVRPWPRLDQIDAAGLVAALDSPNGWQRDMATQMLTWRGGRSAVGPLDNLLGSAAAPLTRLHALCALDRLHGLSLARLRAALKDPDAGVRRHAVRIAERNLERNDRLFADVVALTADDDAQVRLQLACTLGAVRSPRSAGALAVLALRADDSFQTSAVLSSLHAQNAADVASEVLRQIPKKSPPTALLHDLLKITVASAHDGSLLRVFTLSVAPHGEEDASWRWMALAAMLDALERREGADSSLRRAVQQAAGEAIARMAASARRAAGDDQRPEADRLAALPLLARAPPDRDHDLALLATLLRPQQSAALQQAAADALARIADPRALDALLAGWQGHSPSLKSRLIDLVLSRTDGPPVLLAHIAAGDVPATDFDAARRQRLLGHQEAEVREQAARLLSGTVSADRAAILDKYRGALALPGDVERGRMVFARTCAVCHRLGETGHHVGPNLAALANKSPQALLMEIFDPNRNLDSRYVEYTAVTSAGRTHTGLLHEETTSSITLRGQEGKQETLLRADLEELSGSGKSLMPEGLEKDLSLADVADLLAFLTEVGPPPKRFAGNRPGLVTAAKGQIALLATSASIFGGDIVYEEPFRNIGFWHGAGDHVVWTVELADAAEFDVWLDWACDGGSAGNRFLLTGGEPVVRGEVSATGGWDRYRQQKVATLRLPAGVQRLTLQPDGDHLRGALMDLRGVYLVPPGQQPQVALADASIADDSPADVAAIARQILDDGRQGDNRAALIRQHLDQAAALVRAMTADLKPDPKEEYRRIPWIWNVAIHAGRENKPEVLTALLDASLPKPDQPLRDWQAVVIGGGIINGISQLNLWPKERVAELIGKDKELSARWDRLLKLSAEMADNEKTPTGTRYDALRIIPLDTWDRAGGQLRKYLGQGTNDELQMGAVSGVSDVDRPETAGLLIAGLEHFSEGNRSLAVEALLRTDQRALALLAALEQKQVLPKLLSDAQKEKLREHKNAEVQKRARILLEN